MKITIKTEAPTDSEGNVQDVTPRQVEGGTGQLSWDIIQSGLYPAIVTKIEDKQYKAGYGKHQNPDSPDGKWDYYAVTPYVQIPHYITGKELRDVMTEDGVMQQEVDVDVVDYITGLPKRDLTVAVIKDGSPYRVQQDGKSALFRGNGGAYDMFTALGLFSVDGTEIVMNDSVDIVQNRVVWVGVRYAGYAKRMNGATLNWDADSKRNWNTGEVIKQGFAQFLKDEAMNEIEVSYETTEAWASWASSEKWETRITLTLAQVCEIVDAYNRAKEEEWGKVDDGYGIRIKNEITYWGGMTQADAEKRGYFYMEDTKQVFVSEDDYKTYIGMKQLEDNSDQLSMM